MYDGISVTTNQNGLNFLNSQSKRVSYVLYIGHKLSGLKELKGEPLYTSLSRAFPRNIK